MTTVTVPKTEYELLKRRADAYDRIIGVAAEELFAPPPIRSRRVVLSALKKTRRHNKRFLNSIARGLQRSTYFRD